MKIQCSCGAKYAFDVTPNMAPLRLVCQTCGADISDPVNELIRQELAKTSSPMPSSPIASATAPLGQGIPAYAAPVAPAATAAPVRPTAPMPPAPPAVPVAAAPRLRAHVVETSKTAPTETSVPATERCAKHSELAFEHCRVCSKPICPKCMALFGYVCSPLCKARADSHGINIPVFAGQKSVTEARLWRKVGLVAGAAFLVVGGVLGLWFWYAWFGSTPKPSFSVQFSMPAYSGQSCICSNDQIVFLHGDQIARHDMKANKQIWSRHLVDVKQIDAEIDAEIKATKILIDKANNDNPDHVPSMPDPVKLKKHLLRSAAEALQLRVYGQNVWVSSPGKLVRFDWDTGQPVKEIPLNEGFGQAICRGEELLVMADESGKPVITHINLNTCDTRSEAIPTAPPPEVASTPKGKTPSSKSPGKSPSRSPKSSEMAGLPIGPPGKDSGKPLDPAKVAEKAQHLSTAAKIALPALLANNANQQRALDEMDDQPRRPVLSADFDADQAGDQFMLVPTKDGTFVQYAVHLLERRTVSHSAMKAAPTKSALEGNVTVAKTAEIANEMLNDMQRSRGGDVVVEDESRYQVTVRKPDGKDSWSGEVVGPPRLFPLHTVNVLTANKTLIVLNKDNKKVWQAGLNYNVVGSMDALEEGAARYGQGPCVEHKDGLYVFDQGVLTAFELANGNVRWRYPSVGIAGIFFDDKDMIYVNSTTASPESIKYSRQIDVSQKVGSVIVKIDSKTGKALWVTEPGGLINHVSGKYIYCVQSYNPHEPEEESPYSPDTGFETPPYLRIRRINPGNGKEMWEHFQQRAPLDVQINKNTIQLVFKKEVQVLKFISF